ncbi:MAG: hypothetical protein J2P28_00370 [Actinobacteria bacterium]|nr:hypothetical protein [Actinomycetota bacterium]
MLASEGGGRAAACGIVGRARRASQAAVHTATGLFASLYVTIRLTIQSGVFQVVDWVLIRADRTLIWVVAFSGSIARTGTGRDPLTQRLAQDAWRHYRTA